MSKKELLNRIKSELINWNGSFVYDDEQYAEIYNFLNVLYPGPNWIAWSSEDGYLLIDWDFDNPKDETFFILKYG